MIYQCWLDRLLNRNSEQSLIDRASEAKRKAHGDDDITDRTHERLKKTHISLGFTLDKVIKDLYGKSD